ncbi:response regulator transcription factor [Actinomadura atramentaria]|uniref:response regulator transcription factor n=1 Tax=Actinomadura atramentaria TaxID=1990 RepID=UPI00035C87A7|nr:response regulator transcription factor [Actinomadura atramentaria]
MRVVIAEDHFLLREGLVRLLGEHGIEVAETVDNAPAFLRAVAAARPDAAVVDVRLPPTFTDEGVRAALTARRAAPGLPVLVLSQYVEPSYAAELLADGAGAVGYMLKDRVTNGEQFVEAVRRVAEGGTVMDPEVVSRLIGGARRSPLGDLTKRETEVLALIAEGKSNAGVAGALFVTEKAVAKHINNIFAKLGLSQSQDENRRVLATLAYLNGSS